VCGTVNGTTISCLNSTFGDCCSTKGFCGSSGVYCADGCQEQFGKCDINSSSTLINLATAGAVNNPSAHSDHRTLSTGAIVGIVIGAIVFWSLIGLIVEYLYRRHKRAKANKENKSNNSYQTAHIPTSKNTDQTPAITQIAEVSAESFNSVPYRTIAIDHRLVDDRAAAGYEGAYRGN
jgi:uncharacterized membrane protein YraQ (UPF0718 family)